MNLKIAVQPDKLIQHDGSIQSYSARWSALAARHDVEIVPVNVFAGDIIDRVAKCDAFMWRCDPSAQRRLYAARLLYAIEYGLNLPVFPSLGSRWHFEDKVGQYYWLHAAGLPTPATTVSWTREQAREFCRHAAYPFVLKLATGYQGTNVRLVHDRREALFYVDELFSHGVIGLGYRRASRPRLLLRRIRATGGMLRGNNPYGPTAEADLQYGYFLGQEFLPGNPFDVRVTLIGNRAFAFRRFNRPGDFRASGSGKIDWDPTQVAEDVIRLAYQAARKSGSQTLTTDILWRNGRPVIVELGLAYASWAISTCPGHWVLHDGRQSGQMEWIDGSMDPADAIFEDFIAQVHAIHASHG